MVIGGKFRGGYSAAAVTASGRVIAFGGAFGCVPCAFVRGAVTALDSIGYIACVITNN